MPKTPTGAAGELPDRPAPAPEGSAGASPAPAPDGPGRVVAERKKKYLVAPRQPASSLGPMNLAAFGIAPLPLSVVEQALQANPDIDVVETVGARAAVGASAADGAAEGILVARMTDQKASELLQRGGGRLLVERDQHLYLSDPMLRRPDLVSSLTPYSGPMVEVTLVVLGLNGAPLAEAEVSLFGGMLPATGVTGPDGSVRLRLYGDDPHTISGLYVKPRADYWSFYQRDPEIGTGDPNIVMLHALSESPTLLNFPQQNAAGWGARAMRLDQLPPQFRGQGVKIAVIDSGAATTHRNLARIAAGFDIINKRVDPNTWSEDTLGHGSHCAGVIGAADPAWGIRGFAPEAEIHVCKLFPGGQISQLIEALEYCIEQEIDVVNLSLGGGAFSEALERQIVRARQAGVACIAAAGNSSGAVQYPAASANVLAVSAVGKLGEFPADSYHGETIGPDVDAQGYFTARFSCFGPQVDVCAPGVAIVSAVPPNNFAAWDGTSMAAPHVTGLAALILAHRPEFQGTARSRSPERVERLFQVIRLSAHRVTLGDATRIGSGLPDAPSALGLPLVPGQQAMSWQAMLGSMAGAPGGDGGVGIYPGMANVFGQAPLGLHSFGLGFQMGGMPPQGW
jgi:subtilisin